MFKAFVACMWVAIAMPAFAKQPLSESPDILGVKLGMTLAEVIALQTQRGMTACRVSLTQSGVGYYTTAPCKALPATKHDYFGTVTFKFSPGAASISKATAPDELTVFLYPKSLVGKISDPQNLLVHRVQRHVLYERSKMPSVATIIDNLMAKNGRASEASAAYSMLVLAWVPYYGGFLSSADALGVADGRKTEFSPVKCWNNSMMYGQVDEPSIGTVERMPQGWGSQWAAALQCKLVSIAIIQNTNGSALSVTQDIYDLSKMLQIKSIKLKADAQIKSSLASDLNAAASKQEF